MSSSPQKHLHSNFVMPFGAQFKPEGGTLFRLWAPGAKQVDLCLMTPGATKETVEMPCLKDGWYVLQHQKAKPGDLYQFRINRNLLVPDPASRYQAQDIHGPSMIIDPSEFCWPDQDWQGRLWQEAVIYELHVGTFTPHGTFQGVIEKLDYLIDLGITAIELMPVAQFPGRCNWGYDGTLLFAPNNRYGQPDDLKTLVAAAHQKGLMVFLDVVYNHFGPEGNYLYVYARDAFFSDTFQTPWGSAVNFSDRLSKTVREFFIANALYWLEEFHFDGLRLDAVHAIFDQSRPDILEEIAHAVKTGPGSQKPLHLILENDNNCARYLARDQDRRPQYYSAQWNDDLHHACHTLLTGETEGYYIDYQDSPIQHLGRCLTEGFAYQGEPSSYRNGKERGEPSAHLPPTAFIHFLQNHDQIGNRALGERLPALCKPQDLKLMAALVLLAPSPPLLFMGEEFGAITPFYYFCDFGADIAASVTEGRRKEFASFAKFRLPQSRSQIPDPNSEATFLRSRLDWSCLAEERHQSFFRFYQELLALRQREIIPRLPDINEGQASCQVFSPQALKIQWPLGDNSLLSMILNLRDMPLRIEQPEPSRLLYQVVPKSSPFCDWGCLPPKCFFCFLK